MKKLYVFGLLLSVTFLKNSASDQSTQQQVDAIIANMINNVSHETTPIISSVSQQPNEHSESIPNMLLSNDFLKKTAAMKKTEQEKRRKKCLIVTVCCPCLVGLCITRSIGSCCRCMFGCEKN